MSLMTNRITATETNSGSFPISQAISRGALDSGLEPRVGAAFGAVDSADLFEVTLDLEQVVPFGFWPCSVRQRMEDELLQCRHRG
jgi:hypothetical protein